MKAFYLGIFGWGLFTLGFGLGTTFGMNQSECTHLKDDPFARHRIIQPFDNPTTLKE